MKIQYVSELADVVTRNPTLAANIKENPAETIASIAASPLQSDVWIYRLVVLILGIVVILAIAGALILGFQDADANIPESIIALGSVAIGALAGLLAPSPRQ